MRSPSDQSGVRPTAQAIAPEVLAELLDDTDAPQRLLAVEVVLHNVGPVAYAVIPSRMALAGPRNQRIRPLEPSSLPRYVTPGSHGGGMRTPPFVHTREESDRALVVSAGEKALRPRVLAPGDTSAGWLFFPGAAGRAAAEVARQWRLVVVLEDQEQHAREYVIPIDPPDEPS
jgi:hypothetical protein